MTEKKQRIQLIILISLRSRVHSHIFSIGISELNGQKVLEIYTDVWTLIERQCLAQPQCDSCWNPPNFYFYGINHSIAFEAANRLPFPNFIVKNMSNANGFQVQP